MINRTHSYPQNHNEKKKETKSKIPSSTLLHPLIIIQLNTWESTISKQKLNLDKQSLALPNPLIP
jgi:Trm5-related predicted tRNA methylase